jgi:hypothetical protein
MMPDISISDPNMPLFHLCKPEIVEAVKRYLTEQSLSNRDCVFIREYFYQWVRWCSELGAAHERENRRPALEKLRDHIDWLTSRDGIDDWVIAANDSALYPLWSIGYKL